MSLAVGARLGAYEILAPIGAGGMGEVYRATDTRLGRDVAIKVAKEQFSERFEREARAIALLNHPHICQLYDVGPNYLVMELVEGDAPVGPLPLETALEYARQIADALAAAHEKGIVHRDLKPANIKITPQGMVKVLDFGLAKMPERVSEGSPETSPTLSIHETKAGMILGTAAYMSPEQARGKPVDQRTDIWAFGCVLYEMLTGKRAFGGESISDTVASVLKSDPDWALAPPKVQRLLRACLAKDPRKRLQAIGDYGLLLENAPPVTMVRSRPLPWIAAVAVLALIAAAGWLRPRPTPASTPNVAFSIHAGGILRGPHISPDGASIQYTVNGKNYLRRLDSLQPREVHAGGTFGPAWSPDSRSIAFITNGELQTMRLPESAPVLIGPFRMPSRGRTWGDKGTILVAGVVDESSGGLYAVHATGGETKRIDVPGLKRGRYYIPQFLPGEEDLLFAFAPASSGDTEIYLARFDGRNVANPILLFKNDTAAQFTPAGGGYILFVRGDNLYAQRLDLKARRLVGDAELIAESVASTPFYHDALFSVSRNGEIAWRSGKADLSEIAVFSRQGKQIGTVGTPSPVIDFRLSPDETRLLGGSEDEAWLFESDQRGRLRLGREAAWLTWSPDGSRILGLNGQRVVERSVNGSGEVREIAHADDSPFTLDISSDGKVLLLSGNSSIASVRLDGSVGERTPKLLVQTDEVVRYAKFSPDTRWILYKAQPRNGGGGIYVQPFPGPGLRKQIASATFALSPVWRADGKEILYYDDNHIWSVRVDRSGEELRFSSPEALFSVRVPLYVIPASSMLAVSRDGSRIYCLQSVEQPDSDVINVRMGLWK